jgi:hypothetical protein
MADRATLRYSIDVAAQLAIGSTHLPCRVRNLSIGGAFVRGPALPIGTRVTLLLTVPTISIEVACVACWNTADGSGLRFDVPAVDAHALARLVRHASRGTRPLPTDAILVER